MTFGGDAENLAFGANLWPRVSPGGNRVVFVSNREFGGTSLAKGQHGLFWIDGVGSPQRLISADLVVEREFPAFGMDDAGTRVVFASDADLTGENPDGNAEIFTVALPSGMVTQITDTSGEVVNARPILSGDALKVAFLSNEDLGGFGQNSDGSQELGLPFRRGPPLRGPICAGNKPAGDTESDRGSHALDGLVFDGPRRLADGDVHEC